MNKAAGRGSFYLSPEGRLGLALAVSVLLHGLVLSKPGAWRTLSPGSPPASNTLTVHLATLPQETRDKITVPSTTTPAAPTLTPAQSVSEQPSTSSLPLQVPRPAEQPPQASASGQAPGLVFGPWYYPARWLHRRPTPLKPIQPEYPRTLAETPGRVTLLLFINEAGTVDRYQLVTPEETDDFATSAIAAFREARYAPGMITGYAVRSQLLVEVVFEPGQPPTVGLPIDLPDGLRSVMQ